MRDSEVSAGGRKRGTGLKSVNLEEVVDRKGAGSSFLARGVAHLIEMDARPWAGGCASIERD